MVSSIEIESDNHCSSIFIVRTGKEEYELKKWDTEVRLRAWAIVGGTMALSLEDHSMTERFNYCAERDSELHNYKDWNGVSFLHYEGGVDTIVDYAMRAIAQRDLRDERMAQVGPPRFSPVFYDEGNACDFICKWNGRNTHPSFYQGPEDWRHGGAFYVIPITVNSDYYAGRGELRTQKYMDDNWRNAVDLYEAFPEGMSLKELWKLTPYEFSLYLEMAALLQSYDTHPVRTFE